MAGNNNKVKIDAELNVSLNSKSLQQQARRTVKTVEREIASLASQVDVTKLIRANMPSRAFRDYEAPLGKINGLVNDFDKSLAASNARVLAFGASVASVGAVERAFSSLLDSTIDVQKALKELQVISEASNSEIVEYGNRLFDVARNTATSFKDAAKAALEFSRQGLAMNQIIERTNDTMIMMRLTGISLDEAINGLTATINAFSNEDLSSSEILNALSAIDLAAAASTDGIIQGMARSASAARSAGVSFRELAAFIATLQETTGLQGGVLGNSAKSIFTRIIDPSKLQTLKGFGIKVESDNGELLETMDILKNMAKTINGLGGVQVFGDRSELVKFLKEMSGLYQIDKLTSLMNDLGRSLESLPEEKIKEIESSLNSFGLSLSGPDGLKQGVDVLKEISIQIKNTSDEAQKSKLQQLYKEVEKGVSRYDRNLLNANQAVDEAYQKNAILNQTLDAQIQKLKTTGIELGSAFGNTAFLDDLTSGLSTVNNLLEKITDGIKGEGSLAFLENVVQGIGSILTGPGLVLAIATIGKGISYMAMQTKDSWISFMNLNKASQRQVQYEQLLNNLYQNNADIQAVITDKTISRTAQAQKVISLLDAEVAKSQTLAKIYAEIAATMTSMTTLNVSQANIGAYQKGKFVKNRASGDNAFVKEQKAIQMGIGGARKNASPVIMNNFPLDGIKQTVVANTDEFIVDTGNGKYKILNRNQIKELTNSKNFAKGSIRESSKFNPIGEAFITRDITKGVINKINALSGVADKAAGSTENLSKAISKDSVEREKSLTGLIKWSIAASFLNGALLDVSEGASTTAIVFSKLGKALSTFITMKMASSAFGFGMSGKDVINAPLESAKSFLGGFSKAREIGKSNMASWRAGDTKTISLILNSFKTLGPVLKGVIGAFTKFLPIIGWVATAWQLMPDRWQDSIINRFKKSFGLLETPADRAAKSLEELAIQSAKATEGISGQDIAKNIEKAIENYRVSNITKDKKAYEEVKTGDELINKSIEEVLKSSVGTPKSLTNAILDEVLKNVRITNQWSRVRITPELQNEINKSIKNRISKAVEQGDWENVYKGTAITAELGPYAGAGATYSTRGNISYESLRDNAGSAKLAADIYIQQRKAQKLQSQEVQEEITKLRTSGRIAEIPEYLKKISDEADIIYAAEVDKLIEAFTETKKYRDEAALSSDRAYRSLVEFLKKAPIMGEDELKKLGISDKDAKKIREIQISIVTKIKNFISDIGDILKKTSILNNIPTELDSSLIRKNIYGSAAEKIQAQGSIEQRNILRERTSNILSIRELAAKFLKENLTSLGSGFSKDNLDETLRKINQATSANEIQNIFIEIGKWGKQFQNLNHEAAQKAKDFFRTIENKDLETASKELKDSINKASTALGEFDKYFSSTRFKEALNNLETQINEFTARIKNIDYNNTIQQTILSARKTISPSLSTGIEAQKSQLDYESNMRKIMLEQQRYFAEVEREVVQRISNLSSSQDRDELMNIVNGIRRSEGGFSDIQEVSALVGKIAKAEEEAFLQENRQRLALAIQELRSADMQYKAANIQLSAAEQTSKAIQEQLNNRQAKISVQNILPSLLKNLPSVTNTLSGKRSFEGDNITKFSQSLLSELQKAFDKTLNIVTPDSIEENARRQQSFSMYGKTYDISTQKAQESIKKLQEQFTLLGNALNQRVNIQLTSFSAKIKQTSDAITKMRLNMEKEDVDLESDILLLPDEVKEVVRGFDLLNKANKELAIGQMEVAQANLEQRRSLLEATNRIEDVGKRAEIVQQFDSKKSNDELANIIGRALAEQEVLGLKSTDIFKSSVDDFGKFNEIFKTAINEFDKAVDKIVDKNPRELGNIRGSSIQSLARERNSQTSYNGIGIVNAGGPTDIPSDDDLNPFEGYIEDVETTAVAMSDLTDATTKATETVSKQKEKTEEQIDALGKANADLLKNNDATTKATEAQINYKKAVNEAQKFLERFTIIGNKAITAATAAEKYSYQRQVNINNEGPKNIKGYENMTYQQAMEEALKKGDAGKEDLLKIQEQFNKRLEFKTFNEGWSESLAQMSDDAKRLEENMGKMIGTIKDGFVDVFTDAITGAKSFEDAMTDMVTNVANQIIKHGLNSLISNMFSGVAGLGSGGQQSTPAIYSSQSGMGGGIFSWLTNLFAEGGQVVGGSGVRDDVPALLTGGEYVLKKDVVSRVGKDYLDMLNSGKVSKFATGGYVKGRNSERWYLDNGGYPTDTSKSNTGGNNGFYSPGKYGYGSIVGRNNLKSFATQSFTSGQYDVIKQNDTGGVIGLENESWRISAYGRNADTVENQTTEADKREAFNLADQEQKQADALEKERKKRKKSMWKSIIGMGAMIGLNYITGGIGGNSTWGLAGLFGGGNSSWGKGIQEFQGAFGNGPRGSDQVNILRGLFGMKRLEKQRASGGPITSGTAGRDTTPINAMNGEYVISRDVARNIGTPFLDALNNNRVSFANDGGSQTSGPVGMDFSKLIDKFDEMITVVKEAFETSTGNITINITDNSTGGTQESQQGETSEDNQRLAQRIKEVVRSTILEEKRVGGMLNTTKA